MNPEPDTPPRLSLVIPVFNERENLRPLVAEIADVLRPAGHSFESIFVDDGSRDGSGEALRDLRSAHPEIRVLRFPRNRGQTAAFSAGFRAARGSVVVTLDADLQNDPRDIPRLLEALEGVDAVAGIRRRRADGLVRRTSSRIANFVRNRVTGDDIRDTGCSLKAFRREALGRLPLYRGMHRFLPTLVRIAGGRVAQIEVNHRPRVAGTSKYGVFNRLFVGLADLFAVRWMKSRHVDDDYEEWT